MNTLLQQLAEIDPGVSTGQAAEFRTVSLAIAQRLHGDPTSLPLSLNDWWQWLDDEGYDRDTLALILSQMSTARIGAAAQRQLLSHLEQISTEPEGLAKLIDHVQTLHPLLANDYASLETLALAEQQQLEATAGGMSTKATIGIAVGTFVTGGVAGGLFGYIYGKKKQVVEKSEHIETLARENALRKAKDAENKLISENPFVENMFANVKMTKKQQEAIIENLRSGKSTSGVERNLLRITKNDVEKHSAEFVMQHLITYGKEINDEIEQTIRQNFENTKEVTDEIKKQIDNKDANDENTFFIFTDRKLEDRDEYLDAFNTVKQGEWYKKAFTAYRNNAIGPLRINSVKVIKDAYQNSIRNEIALAKEKALKDAKRKTDSLLIDKSGYIDRKVSAMKTKLDKDIRKVATNSEREVDNEFIAIEDAGSEISQ
jgi:hypothetical protein